MRIRMGRPLQGCQREQASDGGVSGEFLSRAWLAARERLGLEGRARDEGDRGIDPAVGEIRAPPETTGSGEALLANPYGKRR